MDVRVWEVQDQPIGVIGSGPMSLQTQMVPRPAVLTGVGLTPAPHPSGMGDVISSDAWESPTYQECGWQATSSIPPRS